jgi:hypothetical protein
MKVAVYGTARNEAANVADWLASVADADYIAINDTGSSDDTYQMLLDAAAVGMLDSATQLPVEPMLLCNALNLVMGLIPDDIDLVMRLDLDERLQPGWRDTLEATCAGRTERMIVKPWFDQAGCIYKHTRIHSRTGFRWELPVHEILVDKIGNAVHVDVDLTIEHHQDLTKDRSQVLGELQDALAADPTNQRLMHYLAREYTYRGDWGAAIPLLHQHLATDAFPEERAESCRLLGDAYRALIPSEDVPRTPYLTATVLCPERREGWVQLAELEMLQGRWADCLDHAQRALAITERNWHFNHAWAWGAIPYDLAALASLNLGDTRAAIEYGKKAVELDPTNERIVANLAWYTIADADRKVRSADG